MFTQNAACSITKPNMFTQNAACSNDINQAFDDIYATGC